MDTRETYANNLKEIQSYLKHWLDDYNEVALDVEAEGPGRALYERGVAEVKAALAATKFVEAILSGKKPGELKRLADQLEKNLGQWKARVEHE